MQALSGKSIAASILDEVRINTTELKSKGINPTIAIVVATDDEAAHYYVRSICKTAEKTGIHALKAELSPQASFDEISQALTKLARDKAVHGIILQTPLAPDMQVDDLRAIIPPEKDIDGANPLSAGRLMSDMLAFSPATPTAVMEILKRYNIKLVGSRAVIVGRSRVVGKPLAHLLLAADATVTVCHSKTSDLAAVTRQADILVVATGKPELIKKEHIKPGVVLIDVGTNVGEDGKLVGDIDAASARNIAAALTPVPGGVGPVTTALLLKHVIDAVK